MPNYYVGVPVTYTALAQTLERPSDTFAYAWSFDDATTMTGPSGNKVWSTPGSHTATVVATDNQLLTTGTASKTITISSVPIKFSQPFTYMYGNSLLSSIASNKGGGLHPETSVDYAFTWQVQASYPDSVTVSMSGDGTKLLFGSASILYKSLDSGATWADTGVPAYGWDSVAVSRDGTHMMAVTNAVTDYPYMSSDSGATWAAVTSFGSDSIDLCTISSTGQYIYALSVSRHIGRSSDYGATWANSASSFIGIPVSWISCNDSGSVVAICASSDYIYISSDYGNTFVKNVSAGSKAWSMIRVSGSGTAMVAIANGSTDYIYVSTDSGATWAPSLSSGPKNWNNVLLSQDGTKIVASWWDGSGSRCSTSFDFGMTWV